jgi:hypothetical protein
MGGAVHWSTVDRAGVLLSGAAREGGSGHGLVKVKYIFYFKQV